MKNRLLRSLLFSLFMLNISFTNIYALDVNPSIYAFLQNESYTECLAEVNYHSFDSATEMVNYLATNCYHPAFEQINLDQFSENLTQLNAYSGIDPGFSPAPASFTPQSIYFDFVILFPDCMYGVSSDDFIASIGNDDVYLSSYCQSEFAVLFDDYLLNNTVPSPVGLVDDIEQGDIKVYPNPADNFIQIDLPQNIDKSDIKIYNVSGALVVEEAIYGNHSGIEFDIPQGIYIAEFIVNDKIVQSSKLIVKR